MSIRMATVTDVKAIQGLINGYAKKHRLIPRSLSDLYERIRDTFVYEDAKGIVRGTCALHVVWEDLAEIRSLAVSQRHRKKGIGKSLVKRALADARKLGITRVFVLTYYPEYFIKLGFNPIDKSTLPHKIWSDCLNCPLFPECEEEAVMIEL